MMQIFLLLILEETKIDLTEYYDLIYEYKNDCLIAGIKYKNPTMKIEILNHLKIYYLVLL